MKPSRKKKKTAKPPTPQPAKSKFRRRSLKSVNLHRLWEITARPDAEYDCFDVGIRESDGDVRLVAHTYNEDDAKLLVAAGAALAAANNSDESQVLQLRHSLDGVIELWPTGFAKKNLLPHKTVEHIHFAHFLTYAVPPAQEAQRATGVPASLLIAEAITQFGTEGREIGVHSDGNFNIGRVGIDAWFLAVAKRRAKTVALAPALAAAGDRAAFIEELRKCEGVWKPEVRGDILQLLTYYDLQDCDAPRRQRAEEAV